MNKLDKTQKVELERIDRQIELLKREYQMNERDYRRRMSVYIAIVLFCFIMAVKVWLS